MTGNQAVKIVAWVIKTLESKTDFTDFEKQLLEKATQVEISIPGYGRVPAIEVKDLAPNMKIVLDDGTIWVVDTIHKVENNLYEIALNGAGRQIIRKRYSTKMGYLKEPQHAND